MRPTRVHFMNGVVELGLVMNVSARVCVHRADTTLYNKARSYSIYIWQSITDTQTIYLHGDLLFRPVCVRGCTGREGILTHFISINMSFKLLRST